MKVRLPTTRLALAEYEDADLPRLTALLGDPITMAHWPAALDATCDGVDDDCDGAIDENYVPLPTSCGVGACGASGATSCQAGSVVDSCSPGTPAGNDSTCDGVDDDCDGSADEDYAPVATSCVRDKPNSCSLSEENRSESMTAGVPSAQTAPS